MWSTLKGSTCTSVQKSRCWDIWWSIDCGFRFLSQSVTWGDIYLCGRVTVWLHVWHTEVSWDFFPEFSLHPLQNPWETQEHPLELQVLKMNTLDFNDNSSHWWLTEEFGFRDCAVLLLTVMGPFRLHIHTTLWWAVANRWPFTLRLPRAATWAPQVSAHRKIQV